MRECIFCRKEATGSQILDKWQFNMCNSSECKRKITIIFKILLGDLSEETLVEMARAIPDDELYVGKLRLKQ